MKTKQPVFLRKQSTRIENAPRAVRISLSALSHFLGPVNNTKYKKILIKKSYKCQNNKKHDTIATNKKRNSWNETEKAKIVKKSEIISVTQNKLKEMTIVK